MPDHLRFEVPVARQPVTLNMKRTKLLPTATSTSDLTQPFLKDAAVYTDVNHLGSMIVRRNRGRQYSLQGSFVHDQAEWHLEPLSRVRRQADGNVSHRLLAEPPDEETISYVGDAIEDEEPEYSHKEIIFYAWDAINDDEPAVEILSLEARNYYRLLKLNKHKAGGTNVTHGSIPDEPEDLQKNGTVNRASVEHVVEMVFVADYADYQKSISDPNLSIGTRVTFLKILTRDSDDDFIEDLTSSGVFDGPAALSAFRTWYQEPANGIPNADHYMLFTGFDMQNYIGIAYLSRLCTASGVSITENRFNAWVAKTAAHEVGHRASKNDMVE
ncbi:hypothetical protein EGW08_006830 [Elysia chlorotica]|uniref:Peptidase M12B domain-containing protein n=1 Tax=Elysia chlorotica TaxID=188477 RepID=A0A433TV74_ELYCH|nr:hypothetical protein EGW08_006830 [Elysia chlorotica]